MSKTMSVRMDRGNYEFLHEITKEEGSDLSKAVRDMVTRGRILLAVERYKEGRGFPRQGCGIGGGSLGTNDDNPYGIRGRKQVGKGRLSPGTQESPKGLVMTSMQPRRGQPWSLKISRSGNVVSIAVNGGKT